MSLNGNEVTCFWNEFMTIIDKTKLVFAYKPSLRQHSHDMKILLIVDFFLLFGRLEMASR